MSALVIALLAGCVPVLESPDGGEGPVEWVAPENSWSQGDDPSRLVAGGFNEGDVIPDFRMRDQHGDEVALWQFYGMVVLLDISTTWCGPCRVLAADAQETYEAYVDQGFMYVTVLAENETFSPPNQGDLVEWAETYGLEAPVLSDTSQYAYQAEPNSGWPAILVIDRDMVVAVERVTPPTDATIRAAIEAAL